MEPNPPRRRLNGFKFETTSDDREDHARARGDREARTEAGEERGEEAGRSGAGGRARGARVARGRGDGKRLSGASGDYPVLAFESEDAWEAWLRERHADEPGVWIKIAKKGSGIPSVTHASALDAALCYGWIDGQARSIDETWYVQKFTPRRARSLWSKRNREKVAALIEAGPMQPAGLAEIERAKADGRWDAAYDGPAAAVVPDDLREALDAVPAAAELFAGLNSQNRFAILHRIQTAVKPETRAKRVAQFVEMLARGEKPYP